MKRNLTALGAALLIGLPAANAAHLTPAQFQEKMQSPDNAFRWAPKSKALPSEWAKLAPRASKAAKAPVTETDVQLPTSEGASYLDMPDGTNWTTEGTSGRWDERVAGEKADDLAAWLEKIIEGQM